MVNIWTIAKREFKLYFTSPVAYVVFAFILGILGIFFYLNIQVAITQPGYVPGIDATLVPLGTLLVFIVPALTTRLLAEEQRLGTIELLLTAPVRDWELVVGKWLGAFGFLLVLSAFTIVFPLILNQFVNPGIDQGPLISGYLGLFLLCAAMAAVGVWISSLFSNQIAAFIATLAGMVFLWWIIGPIAQVIGQASGGAPLLSYLDFNDHYFSNLVRGVIDLSDIVYYLSATALFLFLGTVTVETRRWR